MKSKAGRKGCVPFVGGACESRLGRHRGGPERWALEGSLEGLDLILSLGSIGKFKDKNWTKYPRSRRAVRGCWEQARSWLGKTLSGSGAGCSDKGGVGGRGVCFRP